MTGRIGPFAPKPRTQPPFRVNQVLGSRNLPVAVQGDGKNVEPLELGYPAPFPVNRAVSRYSMNRPLQPWAVSPTAAAAPMMPSFVPPWPERCIPRAASRASLWRHNLTGALLAESDQPRQRGIAFMGDAKSGIAPFQRMAFQMPDSPRDEIIQQAHVGHFHDHACTAVVRGIGDVFMDQKLLAHHSP